MLKLRRSALVVTQFLLGLAVAAPASAQKSKDTLRMAANEAYAILSPYDLGLNEVSPIYEEIYSRLLVYNEHKSQWIPELAKSWKHLNPTTIEFELRDDIVLHSGKKFEADDIVASVEYAIDPAVKIRNKQRYMWVKSIEKAGPHKVIVHLAQPYALDLFSFSYRFVVEDSDILRKLDNKEDYGRVSAASAGPYRLVSMTRNAGYVLERFDKLSPHLAGHRRAPIRRIEVTPILDRQTQVAQIMTGGIDLLRNVPEDAADALAKNPNIKITPTASSDYIYFTLDALARSGRTEFKDVRVRKAIFMAIDREKIAREIVSGGEVAEQLDGICFSFTVACSPSVKPYKYDPAQAKRLLAEAGYPNGFEMPLFAHDPMKDVAVAMSGDLLKVGIKASVQPMTISIYQKARQEGKLTAFVGSHPTAIFPETLEELRTFFGGSNDYWQDPIINNAIVEGGKIADDKQRALTLRPALDRINSEAYILTVSSLPWMFVHTKDVRIGSNDLKSHAVHISDIFWN